MSRINLQRNGLERLADTCGPWRIFESGSDILIFRLQYGLALHSAPRRNLGQGRQRPRRGYHAGYGWPPSGQLSLEADAGHLQAMLPGGYDRGEAVPVLLEPVAAGYMTGVLDCELQTNMEKLTDPPYKK